MFTQHLLNITHRMDKVVPHLNLLKNNIVDISLEMEIKNIIVSNLVYYLQFDKDLTNLSKGIQLDVMNLDKSKYNCK